MGGPISTFVDDLTKVIKPVTDVLFRGGNPPVSKVAGDLNRRLSEALAGLARIEAGTGSVEMSADAAWDAFHVARRARVIVTQLADSVRTAPMSMTLRDLRATPAFADGLQKMIMWAAPIMRNALKQDRPVLDKWLGITSRFQCVVFGALVAGGFLAWNLSRRQNSCDFRPLS